MSCSSRPLFFKTAIGLAAAALAAIIAEVWLDARAAHEHTGMPPYNNLILLAAFASAMLAPLVYLHGRGQARAGTPPAIPAQRHRPEPAVAAADIASDTDGAPTIAIVTRAARGLVPLPRVYLSAPEPQSPLTKTMIPLDDALRLYGKVGDIRFDAGFTAGAGLAMPPDDGEPRPVNGHDLN